MRGKVLCLVLVISAASMVVCGVVPTEEAFAPVLRTEATFTNEPSDVSFDYRSDVGFSEEDLEALDREVARLQEEEMKDSFAAHASPFLRGGIGSSIGCTACALAFRALRWINKYRPGRWTTVKIAQIVCRVGRIEDKRVCTTVIEEFRDLFMFIIRNEEFEPKDACGVMHKYTSCPEPIYPTWEVQFDKPKPPVKPYPEVKDGDDRYYVLHMTDLHVDYDYTVGYEADCGEPICCRPPFNKKNPKRPAGQFGDYGCDAPKHLYLDMLQYVKDKFGDKLSFGVLTGDLPPHDVWQETRENTVGIEQWLADEFHNMLPNLKLYPAVGNHESVPVNEFASRQINNKKFDMGWLYDTLADKWAYWLPEDAVEMSRHAGYYTALSPEGVRIVSLNTNMGCNPQNWFLVIPSEESKDPDNMLHWFADTMKAAEEAGEMVYLIYHIAPTGSACLGTGWFKNFHKIMSRYENNVLATFSGHTHQIRYSVTYDKNEDGSVRPMYSTQFAGSMTPNGNRNPTFRIYEVDKRTHAVVDYVQYRANLTQANLDGHITWEELYSAKSAYRLNDFSAESWHQASLLMHKEPDMNMFYWNMTSREVDSVVNKCDQKCLDKYRCKTYVAPPGMKTDEICDK